MKRNRLTLIAAATFALLIVVGFLIRGGRYADGFVPTSGVILLNGEPLSEADVFLVPAELRSETHSYHGASNAEGVYELTGGLPPGEYRVVVRQNMPVDSGSRADEIDQGQVQAMMTSKARRDHRSSANAGKDSRMEQRHSRLPEIYRSAEHTTLRIHVDANGSSSTHLLLTSDAGSQIATADRSKRVTR